MKAKEDMEPVSTLSGVHIDKHNETITRDDENKGESRLADLPLNAEQASETKGGPAAARWQTVIIGDLPAAH